MPGRSKALPLTITLGSILLFFCLVLTALWNFVLIYNLSQLKEYAGHIKQYSGYFQWVMVAIGSFFFVVIIIGVTLFIVFLAKQIILNQMQKNFIDSVTHELKTPLTSLKLYIETLKKHELPKEKKDSFLNIMLKDVERLDTLVNHVLEAAKLEQFGKNIDIQEVDLEKLFNYCIDIVINRYNLDNSVFQVNSNNLIIESDPNALQLILINLIDNAVKYSEEITRVQIEAYKNVSGKIDIVIKDNGVGISASEIKKIFNRFYRVSDELIGTKKGTGLGLFIVKETINKLKGKIEVSSKGKNKGTTFKITLSGDREFV